ncbi:hypothetical protein ACJ72_00753 [Emergomyces africanus]|uniref:Uncharacterized protein n=1 Tax=Emergomyces africanus TaxID=1955775 RepID=A0A1B7P757_9EURO|nr:hypothetical protein ACJ72_00753 [Emergomyces africanus]
MTNIQWAELTTSQLRTTTSSPSLLCIGSAISYSSYTFTFLDSDEVPSSGYFQSHTLPSDQEGGENHIELLERLQPAYLLRSSSLLDYASLRTRCVSSSLNVLAFASPKKIANWRCLEDKSRAEMSANSSAQPSQLWTTDSF